MRSGAGVSASIGKSAFLLQCEPSHTSRLSAAPILPRLGRMPSRPQQKNETFVGGRIRTKREDSMRRSAALFPIALALGAISLAPRAGERHIVLTNNTSQPIIEIYAAEDGRENWRDDGL